MTLAFCLATTGVTVLAGYIEHYHCTSNDDPGVCSDIECGDCDDQN